MHRAKGVAGEDPIPRIPGIICVYAPEACTSTVGALNDKRDRRSFSKLEW